MLWDVPGAEAVAVVRAWRNRDRRYDALRLRPPPQRRYRRQAAAATGSCGGRRPPRTRLFAGGCGGNVTATSAANDVWSLTAWHEPWLVPCGWCTTVDEKREERSDAFDGSRRSAGGVATVTIGLAARVDRLGVHWWPLRPGRSDAPADAGTESSPEAAPRRSIGRAAGVAGGQTSLREPLPGVLRDGHRTTHLSPVRRLIGAPRWFRATPGCDGSA
jgi:hypothetical protein